MDLQEFRAKRLGYKPLTPASIKSGDQALPRLKKAAKGGFNALGLDLWIAGMTEAFTSDTATDWNKAAAAGSIIPFLGCGLGAKADADKGESDWVDTVLCATADALTLTPVAPLGILLHIYRFFFANWHNLSHCLNSSTCGGFAIVHGRAFSTRKYTRNFIQITASKSA